MESITVIEVSSESAENKTGYGRDTAEAHANGGWLDLPLDAKFREVEIVDKKDDAFSASVANVVCGYHINEDTDLPDWLRKELREMVEAGRYATALQYVFDMVWDAGFEEMLPPAERKYLP